MVIGPGQPGRNDWTYQMNPLFMTLSEPLAYANIGIGFYAKNYGYPELIYCMPKPAIDTLGYTMSNSYMSLADGSVEENQAFRNKIATSPSICIFNYYKWAILKIPHYVTTLTDIVDQTDYIIYVNVNGNVRRASYQDASGHVWRSMYRRKTGDRGYSSGSNDIGTGLLRLFELGQVYNSEYNRLMFTAEDAVIGDAGYDAMIAYLQSEDAYPDGKDTPTDPKDPYGPIIGPSGPGGGGGTGREFSLIDEPDLPFISSVGTGFTSLWSPSLSDLQALGRKLWSTDFFDQIIKNFQSPFDSLLSLSIVPFTVSGVDGQRMYIGNYDTEIDSTKILRQYVSKDLGSCEINEEVGSYLDYSPYTRMHLYLPYIGFVQIDTDEFMNHEITVKYHIDLLTGACVAYIFVDGYVHLQYSGNVSTQIPLSGRDMSGLYQAAIGIGLSAVGSALSGGLGTALSAGALASSASTIMASKDKVQISGALQGSSGILGVQKPYILLESPNLCLPESQNTFVGYPTYMTVSLGSLSGYTEVDSVHLHDIPCTESELQEIEELLKGGVLL